MQNLTTIKVLYVTNYVQLYGANNSLLQLIIELREKGVVPMVLLPSGDAPPGNNIEIELKKLGIQYIEAPIRLDKHRDLIKVLPNYFLSLISRKKAFDAVKDLQFDLIHSNSSTISTGSYIAKKLKRPHVWHLREFGSLDYGMRTPYCKCFQKVIYGGANNTFIAISKIIKNHYQNYIDSRKIRLIYNGIKTSPKRTFEKRGNIEICIVGLLSTSKGQLDVLKAADKLLNHKNISNFHITVVGDGDQVYYEKMKNYVKSHGLTKYVTMTGRRNDVPELLTKMDIGITASSFEAFGRVTVEYMMAGLAVIASDSGANVEIIEDETNGLLYKKGDPSSLADKLERLICNSDERQRLAYNGLRTAQKKFTSRVNSNAVFELYSEILDNR